MRMRHVKPLPLPDNLIILGKPFRLRYLLMVSLMIVFCSILISYLPSPNIVPVHSKILTAQPSIIEKKSEIKYSESESQPVETISAEIENIIETANGAPIVIPRAKPNEIRKHVTLAKGDTLSSFFTKQGLNTTHAYSVIKAFRTVYNPRDVKAGEPFKFDMIRSPIDGSLKLVSLEYSPSIVKTITITPDADGGYIATKDEKELIHKQMASIVNVENSLYGSAARAGLPDHVIVD